ncbi:MAG: CAP domain-containing protein, partial [Delftia sp.]|nr:CAP domain-containing protein [Delftia sp.]
MTFLTLAVVALLWTAPDAARAQDSTAELLARINAARLAQGLYPYVSSPQLNAAAQRHSDDMAAHGQLGHTGFDGSSETQRILDAGYGAYEFGPVVAESIHQGDGPLDAWMGLQDDRTNLLHQEYREVGIAVTNGYWTVTFGAQPNVLPVLVNNGAGSVDTLTVTLTLVPENAVPDGLGTAIGQPLEYRASTDEQFSGAEWQTWQPKVSFMLDES